MSCDVGHRHSLDPALLRLWHKPAAVAPVRPLAWESSYAMNGALKKGTKKNIFKVRVGYEWEEVNGGFLGYILFLVLSSGYVRAHLIKIY